MCRSREAIFFFYISTDEASTSILLTSQMSSVSDSGRNGEGVKRKPQRLSENWGEKALL